MRIISTALNPEGIYTLSQDWMDLWDLGILIANRAYQAGRRGNFWPSLAFAALRVKGFGVEAFSGM